MVLELVVRPVAVGGGVVLGHRGLRRSVGLVREGRVGRAEEDSRAGGWTIVGRPLGARGQAGTGRLGGGALARCRDHPGQGAVQRLELGHAHAQRGDHLARDAFGLGAQGPALVGEVDHEDPLVVRVTVAGDQTGRGQPLDQRREGAGVQGEQRPDVLDGDRCVLPQGEHHEVLRVGEPHRLQQRAVDPEHAARGDRQGEADLSFEGERVVDRRGSGRGGGGGGHGGQTSGSKRVSFNCAQSNGE